MSITTGGRCWGARAGRLAESLAHAAHFRTIAAELDDARLKAWCAMEAEPLFYLGRWEELVRVANEGLPSAWEIGEPTVITMVSSWCGLSYLKLDRRDEARLVIDRALKWGQTRLAGMPAPLAYTLTARTLSHLAAGEVSEALASARRGLEIATQGRFLLEQGTAHRVLGQTHEASSHRTEARAAYQASLDIFESIQSLGELGQTLLAYGRFRLADDRAEGQRLVERARRIFAEIGATGWSVEAAALEGAAR
jgi:tetratricopeptide (TPR) repeat protein